MYSPSVPASTARHLSIMRAGRTWPSSLNRTLRGNDLQRSIERPMKNPQSGQGSAQQPNGVLAVIATDAHAFIQNALLLGPAALPRAHVNRLQVLSLRLLRHPSLLHDSLHGTADCGPEGKKTRCRNEGLLGKILDDSIRNIPNFFWILIYFANFSGGDLLIGTCAISNKR